MFTMCNAAHNACWDTMTARRHLTEQWRHDQVGRRLLPNRTEFINFSERGLINDESSFCSHILLANDLQRHVFPFEKLLLNVRLYLRTEFLMTSASPCNNVEVLYWAKFSNVLMQRGIRMIHGKNYETVFKFVKVMSRKLVASFFRTRCTGMCEKILKLVVSRQSYCNGKNVYFFAHPV